MCVEWTKDYSKIKWLDLKKTLAKARFFKLFSICLSLWLLWILLSLWKCLLHSKSSSFIYLFNYFQKKEYHWPKISYLKLYYIYIRGSQTAICAPNVTRERTDTLILEVFCMFIKNTISLQITSNPNASLLYLWL